MKKYFSLAILLLFFSIACDNVSDIQPENSSDGEIASFPPEYIPPMMPYDEVGILHNQTCDVIYQILKAEKLAGNLNDDSDVLTCARNSGIDYLDENLNLNWGGITTDEYNSMFNFITTNVFDETKLWTPSVDPDLTTTQKSILNQLNFIIDNGTDLATIVSDITALEIYAASICNDDEIVVIMSGLSVARHSLTYWHNNLTKWQQLPYLQKVDRGTGGAKILDINWKRAAKADIAGAIAGGCGGAVAGAISGAVAGAAAGGIGAVPGAVAGAMSGAAAGAISGAIAGTVGSIMMDLLDDWW